MMNVGLNRRRVHPDDRSGLHPLLHRVPVDLTEDRLPGLLPDRLDVLLEDGLAWILAHVEAGEPAEGVGVLQVKGEFLVAELAVLFEDGAAQDLLGCQPLPAGIGTGCPDKILEDKVHEAGIVIENP